MASAAAELQKAIVAALKDDATLTALLGDAKVLDHAPADVAFPYVSFGRSSSYDWSTSTERGSEHIVSLHVWSKARGKKEALEIMERTRELLHDRPLTMTGHTLVNLRLEFSEVRYDEDHGVYHGLLRFRAVVEGG